MGFILNPKHLLSGCGFLWIGHSLLRSLGFLSLSVVWLGLAWVVGGTSVLWTEMGVLESLHLAVDLSFLGWLALDVVCAPKMKLGSFLVFAASQMKLTKNENGGKTTCFSLLYLEPCESHLSWRLKGSFSRMGLTPRAESRELRPIKEWSFLANSSSCSRSPRSRNFE
ncbi:hypothetical protein FKM82_018423 [Ascaphus truei]